MNHGILILCVLCAFVHISAQDFKIGHVHSAELYSLMGESMSASTEQYDSTHIIDTKKLHSGVYVLRIQTCNGVKVATIMIQ